MASAPQRHFAGRANFSSSSDSDDSSRSPSPSPHKDIQPSPVSTNEVPPRRRRFKARVVTTTVAPVRPQPILGFSLFQCHCKHTTASTPDHFLRTGETEGVLRVRPPLPLMSLPHPHPRTRPSPSPRLQIPIQASGRTMEDPLHHHNHQRHRPTLFSAQRQKEPPHQRLTKVRETRHMIPLEKKSVELRLFVYSPWH